MSHSERSLMHPSAVSEGDQIRYSTKLLADCRQNSILTRLRPYCLCEISSLKSSLGIVFGSYKRCDGGPLSEKG